MVDPIKPTRAEIARIFNNDQRLIRAFEQIFDYVPSTILNLDARVTQNEIDILENYEENLAFSFFMGA